MGKRYYIFQVQRPLDLYLCHHRSLLTSSCCTPCIKSSKYAVNQSTLRKACQDRNPAVGLVFHTDRGGQYRSHAFQKTLNSYGMIHSYSESGKPQDNTVVESFFSSLKGEELYQREYSSEAALRKGADEYIYFYNNVRPHSYLYYKTPAQVEQVFHDRQKISNEQFEV